MYVKPEDFYPKFDNKGINYTGWTSDKTFTDTYFDFIKIEFLRRITSAGTDMARFFIPSNITLIACFLMREKDILRLYAKAANARKVGYKMFASLPKLLKEMRKSIPHLKFQFRAEKDDIDVMAKIQTEGDHRFWKELKLKELNPPNNLPVYDFIKPGQMWL